MEDQNKTQNKNKIEISPTASFVGVLLTLLANAITQINLDEFKSAALYIRLLIIITVYFLLMCIILETSITHNIPLMKKIKCNPEETLKKSYDFFVVGILFTAVLIISIMFKSSTQISFPVPDGLIVSVAFLIVVFVSNIEIAKITSKSPAKTEEQAKCIEKDNIAKMAK